MTEIIFLVEDDPEGGYVARAIGEPIFTQGETIEELRKMVQDAVQCHFEDEQRPRKLNPMKRIQQFTAIIEREGDGYISLCPELDIASQGNSIDEAKNNLTEALQLFFEVADPSEVATRLHSEV